MVSTGCCSEEVVEGFGRGAAAEGAAGAGHRTIVRPAQNPCRTCRARHNANPHLWSAWPQLGVTALWAAALLAAGAYLFRKRDA